MGASRSIPRWTIDSLRSALIVAVALTVFSVYSARSDSHDTTYYACLYAGSLTQVNTTAPPVNCGRGTQISWSAVGPEGEQGPPGMSGYEIVEGENEIVAVGSEDGQPVRCPDGKVVMGGGPRWVSGGLMTMEESNPDLDGGGWFAYVRNEGATDLVYRVVISCAFIEPEAAPFQPYQLEDDSPRRSE